MKKLKFAVLLLFKLTICFCQKQLLNTTNVNFTNIGMTKINQDGKFVLYNTYQKGSEASLHIKSVDSTYSKEINGFSEFGKADFIKNGKQVVFLNLRDSLGLFDLESKQEKFIKDCRSYKIAGQGLNEHLAFFLKSGVLIVTNLFSEKRTEYSSITDYFFNTVGSYLILKKELIEDSIKKCILYKLDLKTYQIKTIWKGVKSNNFCFNSSGNKLAFIGNDKNSKGNENLIWYYDSTLDQAQLVVNKMDTLLHKFIIKPSVLKFSADGNKLFFRISKKEFRTKDSISSFTIWSSYDSLLQSEKKQLQTVLKYREYESVVTLENHRIIQLENESDDLVYGQKLNEGRNSNYLLRTIQIRQKGYNDNLLKNVYLVNTTTGESIFVTKGVFFFLRFSSQGKYLIWYDQISKDFFSYEIETRIIRNISSGIKFALYDEAYDGSGQPPPYTTEPALWLDNDISLFVYDKYDIYKLDPKGIVLPINITNGYGRRNKLIFRFIEEANNVTKKTLSRFKSTIVLCAFGEKDKTNGLFECNMSGKTNPLKLIIAKEALYFWDNILKVELSNFFQKAKDAEVYLIKRMTDKEYPNLYVTKNFKEYIKISNVSPQKPYNWLRSELINWISLSGQHREGIIFKPENFDSTKKYPIIFSLYEKQSANLYRFLQPDLCNGPINIPLFVSQGYVVCCPDIHYKVSKIGESAYNDVISAVKAIREKPWVNKNKIGLQGHSFGGYEVNYLITHTNLFAAAAEAAGPTNFVSAYGGLLNNYMDSHSAVEHGQDRFGYTLWENRNAYINNSPIFFADKVSVPLLMMHNRSDGVVLWTQAIEFFTALRRLKKRVWLLEYENEGHVLLDDNNKLDYSIRLLQFFDTFLKNEITPEWMIK